MARLYGFDGIRIYTGIDLPGEKRGMIPNAQFYDKAYRGSWNGLTVISIAIGQGEVTATPLQIANLGATIANRGYFVTPHVVKGIEGEQLDSLYRERRYTKVSEMHYEEVVQGMRSAVLGGTCRMANLPDIEVCGKTGTAQNHGKDHSAFMGFAPMDNPKIAIAVYVENGGWGCNLWCAHWPFDDRTIPYGKTDGTDEALASTFNTEG